MFTTGNAANERIKLTSELSANARKSCKLRIIPAMSAKYFFHGMFVVSLEKFKLNVTFWPCHSLWSMFWSIAHTLFFFSFFLKQKLCTLTLFASTQNKRPPLLRSSRLKMIMQKKCCVRSNISTQRKFYLFKFIHYLFYITRT